MKIPQTIEKDNRKYKFIKKCNDTTFLYEEIQYGYKKCFSKYDLGLIKPIKIVKNIKPENDKYF